MAKRIQFSKAMHVRTEEDAEAGMAVNVPDILAKNMRHTTKRVRSAE